MAMIGRTVMIGSAIERGSLICAFDERGMTLFSLYLSSSANKLGGHDLALGDIAGISA
jgi:hypothetical protein